MFFIFHFCTFPPQVDTVKDAFQYVFQMNDKDTVKKGALEEWEFNEKVQVINSIIFFSEWYKTQNMNYKESKKCQLYVVSKNISKVWVENIVESRTNINHASIFFFFSFSTSFFFLFFWNSSKESFLYFPYVCVL